jgi:polyphosphate kinase
VFLVLAPLAFDPGRPFPHISNLSLNLAVVVQDARGEERFARVKIPDTLPQLVPVPAPEGGDRSLRFVWLEQLIIANLQALFPGLEIKEAHPFHVTRDAETSIQELESDDLLETIEEAVWRRRFRDVVRLQVDTRISAHILDILTSQLELVEKDVYLIEGPLDLRRLRELNALDRPDLKYKPFLPYTPAGLQPNAKEDIFTLIRGGDVLLHHPFESFQPVVEFIRRAARDPDVLAIKITLYRVGRNSPIVQALLEAVEEGKQVSVLLELKARFDEESNIEWAKALEREGVHVIYGLVGLKVHSKIALVVRREGDIMRRYVHLGTGNYNPLTARMYTDLSLFTCDEQIGADATDLFNYLTGYSAKTDFRKLLVAPVSLRRRMEGLILREIEIAKHGGKGHLIFKMNALEDPEMIKLLYRASQAGVQVDLLVRGLCCLRPRIPGVSDRIRVSSVIGRFLEHSRIYYFRNGGREEVFLGSADLMLRNLNHRIEIVFPVESPSLVHRIRHEILEVYLADDVNAYQAHSDGSYTRAPRSETTGGVDSHQRFMARRSSRLHWNEHL